MSCRVALTTVTRPFRVRHHADVGQQDGVPDHATMNAVVSPRKKFIASIAGSDLVRDTAFWIETVPTG